MVWFRVDDNLAFHRKTLKAGNAAMGMWVRAGSEIANQLTDGHVPDELAGLLGPSTQADRLVSAGLWIPADGGYDFHEWVGRQPTKAQVERDRKNAKVRKDRWRNGRHDGEGTA
jgi:hypothetical protein